MDKSSTSRAQHPPAQESFERVIFCSGKIYYELDEAREKAGLRDKVRAACGEKAGLQDKVRVAWRGVQGVGPRHVLCDLLDNDEDGMV